ncbi:multidrug resistance-associated protein 1-like [Ixodes scapularis]|uniref:multidrug resistance-associated protein 1-like n=1 Tax=Ixodes scapularis TaxID=6945 RepID=UPI001C392D11|nr:multidrug resistance-associated protein 1-like [Ixodes scapularis]
MSSFCASPLWDWDYTWYSDYPRFTSCFESTVLVYVPASVLIIFGLLPWMLTQAKNDSPRGKPLSWTLLSLLRFLLSFVLLLAYAFSFVYKLITVIPSWASVTADLVRVLVFATTIVFQQRDRKRGSGSSMMLFFFWFTSALCQLPEYFRYLEGVFGFNGVFADFSKLEYGVCVAAYPVILVQVFLASLTDVRQEPRRPYLTAGPVSSLMFGWMTPLILHGYKRSLDFVDLFKVRPDMRSRKKHDEWKARWDKELQEAGYMPGDGSCDASFPQPSLFRSVWKTFWKPVVIACVLAMLRTLFRTAPALLLHLITGYMESDDPTWKGIMYSVGIVLANFTTAMFVRHIDCTLSLTGLNIKAAIIGAIYRKTLRISSESQQSYTVGELVNLVSVDADRVFRLCSGFGFVVAGPLLIAITLALLWQYLGVACLAGVAVMIVIMPMVAVVMSIGHKYQTAQMKLKDKRLKGMAEILSSIKILKLFAWENPFMEKISSIRSEEMELLKKYSYLTAFSCFCMTCSSVLVALTSFVTYVLISDKNILDPTTAFVSLTLFNQMRYSMFLIPDFISNAIQTSVSFKRIRKFLLSSEIDEFSVGRRPDDGEVVTIKNATMAWSWDKEPVLNGVDLSVKTGQLVAIVGPVGSGKSSLMSSLLGDLRVRSGSVNCIKNVAYAPQCAWIQNKTLRDNVLFTKTFEAKLYDKVLKACCLEKDLEILPCGDLTEIGEKGINLSGGQKQRVSLARAAYQMKDLYLFDDPLSAVDAHVGASIFKDLIGPRGMLKGTTRILITHNLSVLSEVDHILVMNSGSVVEAGTYKELQKEGSVLSELLKDFVQRTRKQTEGEESIPEDEPKAEAKQDEPALQLVQKETVEEGSIKLRVYTNYFRHAGPLLIMAISFYAAYRAIDVYNGTWLSDWSTDPLFPDGTQDIALRTYRIEIYALLCFCQAIAGFIGVALLWRAALLASTRLHGLMLYGVMRAPLAFFDATPSGRLLNRFGKDVDQLDVQLPMVGNFFLDFLMQIAGMIVLISINLPIFIFIAIPVVISFLVLRQVYVKPFRQVKRLESISRSPVNNHLSETVSGLTSVRSYGVQRMFVNDNDYKVDVTQNCTVNCIHCNYWMQIRLEVIGDVLLIAMLLLVVTNRDKIDPGMAGLLVAYSLNTIAPFNYLIYFSTEMEASLVSAERLDEYRRLTPEAPWSLDSSPHPSWPGEGAMSFNSYSTRYRDGLELVLKNVELSINPGEKIGIVGRTGAGKSTMTLSLFRIVEAAEGSIVIDGMDISTLGLHDLRSRLTIIPQDPVLFHGTLRYNLDPTGSHASEDLWSALDRAHLGDVFRDEGLDFEVTEGGLNLSVGQRQLICLARAVLRKTKILILDEATASVDMETDAIVQQTLRDHMADYTVLTIAHRLHTVLNSDRVVVMEDGRIKEVGVPAELMEDSESSFYSLALEAGLVHDGRYTSESEN